MTIEELEAFLGVVEWGTLSAAAEKLYISQSTISVRIKNLETELNTSLFIRKQGHRTIQLTSAGYDLVSMAQQCTSLWKDMHNLQHSANKVDISIGSVDLVNNYTFVNFYKNMISEYPHLNLSIYTHHSSEIYSLLENRMIDIGFVFSQFKYPDIISRPIYREKMYLITSKESIYSDGIKISELDPSKEVYLRWGADYELWHDSCWHKAKNLLRVNTGSTLSHYLVEPNVWAIGPMSLAKLLEQYYNTKFCKLEVEPPPRICYQLTHRYPKPSKEEGLKVFAEEVEKYINQNEAICRYEPWMTA